MTKFRHSGYAALTSFFPKHAEEGLNFEILRDFGFAASLLLTSLCQNTEGIDCGLVAADVNNDEYLQNLTSPCRPCLLFTAYCPKRWKHIRDTSVSEFVNWCNTDYVTGVRYLVHFLVNKVYNRHSSDSAIFTAECLCTEVAGFLWGMVRTFVTRPNNTISSVQIHIQALMR